MENTTSDPASSRLQANQILCLEHQSGNLYGEAIQLVRDRQLCWFRPLCLVVSREKSSWRESGAISQQYEVNSIDFQTNDILLIDLQSGSDLLWPEILFRPALDTEIISLLPQLGDIERDSDDKSIKQKCLNKFVRLVWQTERDKF